MRFLFTTFEGGGHVPPALLVARRLRERGHQVLFVSDEANRAQAAKAGLDFATWRRAPNRAAAGQADDPLDDWRRRWPPAVVRSICEAVMTGPAAAYAADTLAFGQLFGPDLIVSNELLFGVMAAAEASSRRLALLTANVWCFPTRDDLPPFGPGFPAASSRFEQQREAGARSMIGRMYDVGLKPLNASRAELGLVPLAHTLEQLRAADLIMLGTSARFDFGRDPPPAPFAYAGPLGEAPSWAADATPDLITAGVPNVLVSFSTTYQGQEKAIARTIRAMADLPVAGIVTLGPALGPEQVGGAPNVKVVESASHDTLMPHCAAVVCHGGHGTVLRPLMHGVPVICMPMGRDHADNAARIVARGAGLRLSRDARPTTIRNALTRLLASPTYRDAASSWGAEIAQTADAGLTAVEAFEQLALSAA